MNARREIDPRPRAWVTGASRGIGKAIAVALAERGYDLVLSARTVRTGDPVEHGISVHAPDSRPLPGTLEETAAAVEATGSRALVVALDLTDADSVRSASAEVLATWPGIDVLVHNGRYVGPGLMDSFLDTPMEAYEHMVSAHGLAPIELTRGVLPGMLDRGRGTIVTITSKAALQLPPSAPGSGGWGHAYSVGKASGHALALALHAEYADRGIRAFNIDPGFVATERNHLRAASLGHDLSRAAPPHVVGEAIARVIDTPGMEVIDGETLLAQDVARRLGLLDGHAP